MCNDGFTCNVGTQLCECATPGGAGCACTDPSQCKALDCTDAGVCGDFVGCTSGTQSCNCTAEGTCDPGLACTDNICQTITSGVQSLDWSYVCTDHLGYNSTSARITGLENGKNYKFLVVAYDKAGNPVFGDVIEARPIPTNGLWEECEAQGNICGNGWTCSVAEPPRGWGWAFGAFGLLGLGAGAMVRRRRRRA